MNTVISLVALCTLVADVSRQPLWHSDYQTALAQGARQNKPLAVFLASGKSGWDKLALDGQLSKEVQKLLAAKYVPVYLNTESGEGKEMASAFELPGGIGLVLSDREGLRQAFWHEGALADSDLVRALEKHADPAVPLLTTETNLVTQTSYYGPAGASTSPFYMEQTYRSQQAFSPSCSH